jgi:arginine/lysine/ornithine decarboxylase
VITAKAAVSDAEALFAEAVGAKQAVFVTCGPSISVHTATMELSVDVSALGIRRRYRRSTS